MKRVFAVCLLLSLSAGAAQAQLNTFPVWFSPAFGSGVGVFANFGTGLNDDAKFGDSAPLAFGGQVVFGASAFKAWAGVNYVDPKVTGADKELSFGGNVGVGIYKGASSPVYVDLMVGVGSAKFGSGATEVKVLNFPISIPLAYGAELQGGTTVEIWVAPHMIYWSTKVGGGSSESDLGFGGGIGLNVYSQMGISGFINADWSSTKFGDAATESTSPLRIGAGVGWKFSVPSLPEGKGLAGG
jgi:hypothetical protein